MNFLVIMEVKLIRLITVDIKIMRLIIIDVKLIGCQPPVVTPFAYTFIVRLCNFLYCTILYSAI